MDSTKATNIKAFPFGAVILAEGDQAPKDMIVLLQGNIGVYKNYQRANETQVKVMGPGSFHGEMALFANQQQGETLVALTNVLVLIFNRKNVREFFVSQPDMAFKIVEGICKKYAEASSSLERIQQGDAKQAPSRKSKLFPPGHGSYTLPLTNTTSDALYQTKTFCPLCEHTFDDLGVLTSKLRLDRTDAHLRSYYKEVEPLYYEVITCPNCFFSAPSHLFSDAAKGSASGVNQKVGSYKLEMYLNTGLERDSFTVFAGFYLALLCAPVVYDDYQVITGNLWLKLSRLYEDCDDQEMYQYALKKSLQDYTYAYENLHISEAQTQQICYIIGDIRLRLGDVDIARQFFFEAKTNPDGNNALKRQADIRLEEIRELKRTANE